MVSVKIYVEGAGSGRKQQAELRKGFKKFLDQVVRPGSFSIRASGSRSEAFGDFCKALRRNERAFLLADAEEVVSDDNRSNPWRHVEKIPKETVFQTVEKLIGRSVDKIKGIRSFTILAELDASKIITACFYARRLKTAIEETQPKG